MENEVEKLARMSADEFATIRRDMATKKDLEDGLRTNKTEILQAINDLGLQVNAWVSDSEHRLKDIEQKIHVLESKVGLR